MSYLNYFDDFQEREEKRNLLIGISIAFLFHISLLFLQFPKDKEKLPEIKPDKKRVNVIKIPIYKQIEKKINEIPIQRISTVPVPDQTLNDEEIIREEKIELPENIDIEIPFINSLPSIPDPPDIDEKPLIVGGDIQAPIRLTQINPVYPEAARRAGIEGKVILQLIIDKNGDVKDVKVLRGLPFGLTEAAVEEAKRQKFKPAYHLSTGIPVDCFWTITITFQIN